MGWDDFKEWTKSAYNKYDKYLVGGFLPGGEDPDDPSRSGGEYAGVNQDNFQLPGAQGFHDRIGGYLNEVDGRQGPKIGAYERAQQSGFAGDQRELAGMLMDRAQGKNSVAEQQWRQGTEAANHQQRSMMAGARPGNAAMAMRVGSQNMATNAMGMTGGAALARAQEAQQAAMGLGGVLAQGRGADENLGMFNASQSNQRQFGQAQMDQQQTAMDDAARAGLMGQDVNVAGLQQQGNMGYEQNRTNRFGATLGVPTNSEATAGLIGGLLKGVSGGGG